MSELMSLWKIKKSKMRNRDKYSRTCSKCELFIDLGSLSLCSQSIVKPCYKDAGTGVCENFEEKMKYKFGPGTKECPICGAKVEEVLMKPRLCSQDNLYECKNCGLFKWGYFQGEIDYHIGDKYFCYVNCDPNCKDVRNKIDIAVEEVRKAYNAGAQSVSN